MDNIRFLKYWRILLTISLSVLFFAPVWGNNPPLRSLKVKIVADQDLASRRGWRNIIEKEIEKAAGPLAEVLRIEIDVVAYETWYRDTKQNLINSTWRMIEEVDRGQADAVVGFCLLPEASGREVLRTDGMTLAYRGMLLKLYDGHPDNNRWLTYVLVHEMIHLFGGVHVDDGGIMSPQFSHDVDLKLDPLNQEIISISRNINLKTGYTSLDHGQLVHLAELYHRAVKQGNQEIPTFLELGAICRLLGETDQARMAYRRIIEVDPSLVYPWVQLGYCFLEESRPEMTIAVLEEALESAAEKDLLYSKLAALYYNQGEYEKSYDNAVMARYHGATVDQSLWDALEQAGAGRNR